MPDNHPISDAITISLHPVSKENWRAVCALQVEDGQKTFVADPGYYLNLYHYEGLWHPFAIQMSDSVIGLLMWAIDDADGSCWLGGILIDKRYQGMGFGRQAVLAAIAKLSSEHGCRQFALSYLPGNTRARHLYLSLGFVETGEAEDDEIVARLVCES